jgi:hypothetical protein
MIVSEFDWYWLDLQCCTALIAKKCLLNDRVDEPYLFREPQAFLPIPTKNIISLTWESCMYSNTKG